MLRRGIGGGLVPGTPEAAVSLLKSELTRWSRMINEAKVMPDDG